MTDDLRRQILAGAYWRVPPAAGAAGAVVYAGAPAAEAETAHRRLSGGGEGIGLLAVTSPDNLYEDWRRNRGASHLAGLLTGLDTDARLVTVLDGHPASLSWIGSVCGHAVGPLGVDRFGQCGGVEELYRVYGIDADAIEAAFRNL